MIGALPFSSAVRRLKRRGAWSIKEVGNKISKKYNGPVIISILCNISYPRKRLVSTFLHNLQIANLDAWYCEIRNLELNRDGCPFLEILFYDIDEQFKIDRKKKKGRGRISTAFNTGQSKVCTHEEFTTTSQLLYLPHESRLVWSILHTPRRCLIKHITKNQGKRTEDYINSLGTWDYQHRQAQEHKSPHYSLCSSSWIGLSPWPYTLLDCLYGFLRPLRPKQGV